MKPLLTGLLPFVLLGACEPTPPPKPDAPPSVKPTAQPSASASTATSAPTPAPPVKPGGPAEPAVKASNTFALELHQKLPTGNLAYSPASISLALAMTYAGAKGDTAGEMRQVFHFPEKVHDAWSTVIARWQQKAEGWEIATANRLFGEKSFNFESPFVALTKDQYGAPLEPLDFRGAPAAQLTHINDWVKTQTRERIENLIPPPAITKDTRLVLVNALYLKAEWLEPFAEAQTADADFFTDATTSEKVPMMNRTEAFRHATVDGVQVVELPYEGEQLAMVVVLPEKRDGLADVEKKLDSGLLDGWIGKLQHGRLWVTLPRFKIDPAESLDLADTLKAMGMPLAFDAEKADFTGIANPPSPADRLYIGHVFHKAFVAVDEKGTEAAAATAVVMPRAGGPPAEPARFLADHPFLFFIRDVDTGAILFIGRVADPRPS